jgi:hypothetical protein
MFWSLAVAVEVVLTLVQVVVQVELLKEEITLSHLAPLSQLKLVPEVPVLPTIREFGEPMAGSQNLDRSRFLVVAEAHPGIG